MALLRELCAWSHCVSGVRCTLRQLTFGILGALPCPCGLGSYQGTLGRPGRPWVSQGTPKGDGRSWWTSISKVMFLAPFCIAPGLPNGSPLGPLIPPSALIPYPLRPKPQQAAIRAPLAKPPHTKLRTRCLRLEKEAQGVPRHRRKKTYEPLIRRQTSTRSSARVA